MSAHRLTPTLVMTAFLRSCHGSSRRFRATASTFTFAQSSSSSRRRRLVFSLCHVGSLPSFGVWFLRRVCRRRRRRSSLVVVSLCPPPRDSGVSTPVVASVVVVVVFSTWRPSSSSSSSVAVVVVVSCSRRLFPLTTYRPSVTSFPLKLERYVEEGGPELCRRLRRRQGPSGLDRRRPHRFLRRAVALPSAAGPPLVVVLWR